MIAKQHPPVNGKPRPSARQHGHRANLRGVSVETAPGIVLHGDLRVWPGGPARGAVVVVHASRLPSLEPRNRVVLEALADAGLATMLLDVFTMHEKVSPHPPANDLELLSDRIVAATRWLQHEPKVAAPRLGVLGMNSSAAPALLATAKLGDRAGAAVAWGGGAELMTARAGDIVVPVLLIVDGHAEDLEREYELRQRLRCPTAVSIIPGVTHQFAQRGPVQRGAQQAADWLATRLATSAAAEAEAAAERLALAG